MPNRMVNHLPETEWQHHKNSLREYYLTSDLPLGGDNGVMVRMETRHNFKASKSQYERHFRKWGWSKYSASTDWKAIGILIASRARLGKKTEVYQDGKLIPPTKVQKQIRRYHLNTIERLSTVPMVKLSERFRICSPALEDRVDRMDIKIYFPPNFEDQTQNLTIELPFREFENLILRHLSQSSSGLAARRNESEIQQYIDPRILIHGQNGAVTFSDDSERQSPQLQGLSSVSYVRMPGAPCEFEKLAKRSPTYGAIISLMPDAVESEEPGQNSLVHRSMGILASPFYRLILFSVANNFSGLGAFKTKQVIEFLQRETTTQIYEFIQLASGYSAKAIAQNLFKAAIELGDIRIIDLLLEKSDNIDLEKLVYVIGRQKYTLLERAAGLSYENVVAVLLKHGAKANKRHRIYLSLWKNREDVPQGDLEISILGGRLNLGIIKMLIDAGGEIGTPAMGFLIENGNEEIIRMVISHSGGRAKWCTTKILICAIMNLDESISTSMVNMWLECREQRELYDDLNRHSGDVDKPDISERDVHWDRRSCPHENYPPNIHPFTLIDAAAESGYFEMVKKLYYSGAGLSDETLPRAISSMDLDLVKFLLKIGVSVDSVDSRAMTPLAQAILSGDNDMISLIKEYGGTKRLKDSASRFSAAMRAALEIFNMKWIQDLFQLGGLVRHKDLRHGLKKAIKAGKDEVAYILIDNGAAVGDELLLEALKRRNEAIVLRLLDCNPSYWINGDAICLAIEWGVAAVVEALLYGDIDMNKVYKSDNNARTTALNIVVEQKDQNMVDVLLRAGADLNNPQAKIESCTALETAAKQGDGEMINFLLVRGADPDDNKALSSTIIHHPEIADLLLQAYFKRYPIARKGYGAGALDKLIQSGDIIRVSNAIDRGLDPNGISDEQILATTPFGIAITKDQGTRLQLVEMMLRKGCNPNDIVSAISANKLTAFHAAISTRNIMMVKLLLKYGADVNFPTRRGVGRTPLQFAAENGDPDILQLLLDHGAVINSPAAYDGGGTALQLAAIGGYTQIACTLISRGAEVDAPASKVHGRTALEGAAEHGRIDMVKLLLNAGAATKGHDRLQIEKAMKLAEENNHLATMDLLKAYLPRKNPDLREKLPPFGSERFEGDQQCQTPVDFDSLLYLTADE